MPKSTFFLARKTVVFIHRHLVHYLKRSNPKFGGHYTPPPFLQDFLGLLRSLKEFEGVLRSLKESARSLPGLSKTFKDFQGACKEPARTFKDFQ